MPRILSITANLLWEMTFEIPSWKAGATQRAASERSQVGGKGINVARALARLGADHLAVLFPGGKTGELCEAALAREKGLRFAAFSSPTPETRTGLVLRSEMQAETTFLGPDRAVPAECFIAAQALLSEQPNDAILALCGSMPGWNDLSSEPLRKILENWKGPLVVDTYGPPLSWLVKRDIALVKINRTEFDAFSPPANVELPRHDLETRIRRAAQDCRARAWIITDGPNPVWLCETDGPPQAFAPPPIKEISATGCGDLLLATLLDAHFNRGATLAAALQHAIPFATAHAGR